MKERLHLLFTIFFDVFSIEALRKIFYRTLLAGLYFAFIELLERHFLSIEFHVPKNIFYILGYVLIMLLYFKIGSSYYRWWDGRKYWSYLGTRGKSLAQELNGILDKQDNESRVWFSQMITNHTYALKEDLRKTFKLDELYEVYPGFKDELREIKDRPNHIVSLIFERLETLYHNGQISHWYYVKIHDYIDKIIEFNEQCRGIRKVPSPSTYTFHLRVFITLYAGLLPFGFIHHHGLEMLFAEMMIYGAYEGCIVISEEIDEPFGLDKYDLPLEEFCYSIKKQVHQLLNVPVTKPS